MRYILFYIACAIMIVACGDHGGTAANAPGIYRGAYGNGKETFEIKNDGTFVQEFTRNSLLVYRNEGKWYIRPDGSIEFAPLLSPFNEYFKVAQHPIKYDSAVGHWERNSTSTTIIFGVDRSPPYQVSKGPE